MCGLLSRQIARHLPYTCARRIAPPFAPNAHAVARTTRHTDPSRVAQARANSLRGYEPTRTRDHEHLPRAVYLRLSLCHLRSCSLSLFFFARLFFFPYASPDPSSPLGTHLANTSLVSRARTQSGEARLREKGTRASREAAAARRRGSERERY